MRRMINGTLWLVGLLVVLAVYFFVPLGRHTLFEHTLRIAATEPAQELGDDLAETGTALGERAVDEWESRRAQRDQARAGGKATEEATAEGAATPPPLAAE